MGAVAQGPLGGRGRWHRGHGIGAAWGQGDVAQGTRHGGRGTGDAWGHGGRGAAAEPAAKSTARPAP